MRIRTQCWPHFRSGGFVEGDAIPAWTELALVGLPVGRFDWGLETRYVVHEDDRVRCCGTGTPLSEEDDGYSAVVNFASIARLVAALGPDAGGRLLQEESDQLAQDAIGVRESEDYAASLR